MDPPSDPPPPTVERPRTAAVAQPSSTEAALGQEPTAELEHESAAAAASKPKLRAIAELAWKAKNAAPARAPTPPATLGTDRSDSHSRFVAAATAVMAADTLAHDHVRKEEAPAVFDVVTDKRQIKLRADLAKATGLSISDTVLIPRFLEAPVGLLSATADAVIMLRETVDSYVPWESFVSTLFITTGIFLAWFVGYVNFGIGWVFVVVFFVQAAYRRNMTRLKGKVGVQAARILGLTRLENDVETVEWLNVFLNRFWLQYEPSLSRSLKETIDPILASSKPGFLDDLALTDFTLGSVAPRVDKIKTILQTTDDTMIMELALLFVPIDDDNVTPRQKRLGTVRQSRVEVTAKLGGMGIGIPMPILLAEIEFRANLRLELKFGPGYPFVTRIDYVFTDTPVVDFVLRPLKSMDLMDMPGLRTSLDGIVSSSLAGFVAPFKNTIDMDAMMNGITRDKPVGVLKITLHEAKKLKNQELAGTSDPYVLIKIGGVEVARTKVVDSSLNPYWGQTLFVPILSSTVQFDSEANVNDKLEIEVFDSNSTTNDKFMGAASSVRLSRWVKLLDAPADEVPVVDGNADAPADAPKELSAPAASKSLSAGSELTDSERDDLVTNWGMPYDDSGSDVWCPLSVREADGKKEQAGSRGQLRLEMSYLPLSLEDPFVKPASTDAPGEAPVTRGILTATIHSLKDYGTQKTSATKVDVLIDNLEYSPTGTKLVASTPVVRKMANPAWDHTARFYVMDSEHTNYNFVVKDSGKIVGDVAISAKDILKNLEAKTADWDWFKLSNSSKIRLTFQWQPVDKNFQTEISEVKGREPVGAIKFKLLRAKNLLNTEMQMLGRKSDPYAKVQVGSLNIGTSLVKENTLDPVWNENYYGVIYSKSQHVSVNFWDFNNLKKDKSMGHTDIAFSDILGFEELEANPPYDLAKLIRDGFKVERVGPQTVQVTAPVYLSKQDLTTVGDDIVGGVKSVSGGAVCAVNKVIAAPKSESIKDVGSEDAALQRGFVYFELEFYHTTTCDAIPALSFKDFEFIHHKREELSKEIHRLKALEEVKVLTPELTAERIKALTDKGYVGDIDPAQAELLLIPSAEDILAKHDSGILRLHLIKARNFIRPMNTYVDVRIDDVSLFTTQIQKSSTTPTWNTTADICLRSFHHQHVAIYVLDARDSEKTGKDDVVIAKWDGKLLDVLGRKNYKVTLAPANEKMFPIDLEVSMGFIPLEVSLTHTTRNSGTLYVDLISASNLEAVDHSGTSDPYVLVSLNGEPLHKSKVHKKELNPVFNESIRAAIKSRQSSSLEFVVKDFNAIGKHVTLGTASADLSLMIPDQLQNMTLPLAGARSGTLTVKLFFDHKTGVAATPDSAAPLTRIGDDDSNAAMKMTKGIGVGTVGIFKELGKTIKGAPKQAQENGVSAAQIAMDQGAEVTDIIPAVDGSDNSSLASVSVSGTLNLTILAARNLKAVDDNGLADPFVMVNQLLHGKVKTLLKTKSKSKNLNPEWNESVQFKIPPSKITIVVLDKNLFGASKPMGEVEVNLQDLIDAGNAFDTWIQVSLGGMGEIHVRGEFYSDGGLAPPSVGLAGRSSFASNANSRTPSPADDEGSEHGTGGVGMFKRNASSLGGLFKAKRAS